MGRPSTNPTFICVSCEGSITGSPTFHVGLPFCCAGCVVGGPCMCSYDPEPSTAVGSEPEAELIFDPRPAVAVLA